jgi:lysophospholipase L1-like esterase
MIIGILMGIHRWHRGIFCFPACAVTAILLLTSSGQARRKTLIVAIGDSTTSGAPYFESPLETPPDGQGDPQGQYGYWMMRRRPQWEIVNQGVAGDTSDQIRARFDDAVNLAPRYIIIMAGVNDIHQGGQPRDVGKNLLWMYQQAQGKSIMPVAVTVPPYNSASPFEQKAIQELNEWIKKAAERMRIPIVDFNTLVRDPANPDRLSDSLDGFHPDVSGYRKMGLAAIEALDPIEKAWR